MTRGSVEAGRAAVAAIRALPAAEGGDPAAVQVVSGWPGWGLVAPVFDSVPDESWSPIAAELDEAMSDAEWRTARRLCDTSFYTPAWLVEQVWRVAVAAGFTGGRVLIPGLGGAAFVTGCPAELRDKVVFTGVEADLVTARVAAVLHPEVTVIGQPMERTDLQRGGFDLVIGNVPFAATPIHDPVRSTLALSLHQYMLVRGCEAVRPGGYVVAITSRYSVDSSGLPASAGADLQTAVRLPSGVFPGTDVVADVVALRKRLRGEPERRWWRVGHRAEGRDRFVHRAPMVSTLWHEFPELVAGRMEATGWDAAPLRVVCDGDPREAVAAAVTAATSMLVPYPEGASSAAWFADVALVDPDGRKEGSFHVTNSGVVRIVAGTAQPVRGNTAELSALIGLRDLTVALVELEADHTAPDEALRPTRDKLRVAYQQYVDRYGPLNRGHLVPGKVDPDTGMQTYAWKRPRLGGFRSDPDAALVWALELYQQDTGEASAAAILHGRVNVAYQPPTRASSPDEALTISLTETGGVDLSRIAGLLNVPVTAAASVLGDRVMRDPDTGAWVRSVDYLAGDVRTKLSRATTAAASDPTYQRNVAALQAVLPADLGPDQIRAALGAPWIPAPVIEQFAMDVLGARTAVAYSSATSSWETDRCSPSRGVAPEAYTTYGTPDLNGYDLLRLALNGKTPRVEKTVRTPHGWRTVADQDATMAAAEKMEALKERFTRWVWEDADRAAALCRRYNILFNSHRPRRPDGSHVRLPGLAPHITAWPWQLDAIDQIISTPATMCALPVGAGKTLTMIGSAMVLKRLGRSTKTLCIVPNHLLEQTVREAVQAFPTGRFLAAGRDDLAGEQRRVFAARCALGDWDAVVMTHESFRSIPVSPADEIAWLEAQEDEYAAALRADPNNRFAAKEIARRLRSLETKLDRLRADKGDPTMVTWSQLGITAIHVDEAVAYKRLPAPCHTAGFNPGSSARALDLKMKVDLLRADDPNRPHVAFYTGTPFTNTILETWVWQTYLQPDRLREAGIDQLDAWIGTFVTMATKVEPSPEGGTLRLITRPYEYRNVAELMAMFSEVAVLVDPATIPLPRPERVDHTVAVDRTAEQARFVGTLAARADAIRNGGSGDDNMLLVCGQGRAAALDPALVGLDGGSPKLDAVIGRVAAEYHAHRDDPIPGSAVPGGLQLLFCDWGVPKPGLVSTYTRLRDGLIAAGVPAGMIRFVHEATDDKSKAALFGACRDGKVAVLIASTEKAGMGTNVQTRLFAVHHVDAPWRPADMEQRDGRALRPGNTYATVQVYRYLTRGTFDAYTYAALARKAHIPAQLIKAATDPTIRDVDELGEVEIGYQQLAALASGNPLLLDRATAAAEVRRLRLMRSISLQNLTTARNVVTETQARTLQLRDTLSAIAIAAGQVEEASADRASLRVVTDECRSMVTSTRPGWGTSMTRSMMWRGLPLIGNVHRSPETDRPTSAAILVRIPRHASLTVGTWPRRWWRASPAQVTEAVNVAINEWVDQLPHLAATLEHDLDQTRRAHDAAAQIVTGWASPYDAPLAAAEARLAQIDAALTADAVTDPLVA